MHPAQGVHGYAESADMQRAAQLSGMVALWFLGLLGLGALCSAWLHDQPELLWAAASTYFLALVMLSRVKGRSRAWSAWGLIPVLGWLPLLAMKDIRDSDSSPPGPLRRAASSALSVSVAALLGLILVGSTISSRSSMHRTRSGWELVESIEAYHESHGVYPTTLDEVEMAGRPDFPSGAMTYQRSADGHQFSLTVAADRIGQYDSNTRTWTQSY